MNKLKVLSVLLLVAVVGVFYLLLQQHKYNESIKQKVQIHKDTSLPDLSLPTTHTPTKEEIKLKDYKVGVPPKVYQILDFISENHVAPEGYVGGRKFFNRENKLEKRDKDGEYIEYQEWDVNPKINGQNRGAERLITGSDHSAYFTKDHYKTFIKLR